MHAFLKQANYHCKKERKKKEGKKADSFVKYDMPSGILRGIQKHWYRAGDGGFLLATLSGLREKATVVWFMNYFKYI